MAYTWLLEVEVADSVLDLGGEVAHGRYSRRE
jgi:hypothetical protein